MGSTTQGVKFPHYILAESDAFANNNNKIEALDCNNEHSYMDIENKFDSKDIQLDLEEDIAAMERMLTDMDKLKS